MSTMQEYPGVTMPMTLRQRLQEHVAVVSAMLVILRRDRDAADNAIIRGSLIGVVSCLEDEIEELKSMLEETKP